MHCILKAEAPKSSIRHSYFEVCVLVGGTRQRAAIAARQCQAVAAALAMPAQPLALEAQLREAVLLQRWAKLQAGYKRTKMVEYLHEDSVLAREVGK
jgi:hypothetical protein